MQSALYGMCQSVCHMGGSVKTLVMLFSPYVGLDSSRNSNVFPMCGASYKSGVGKTSYFLSLYVNISKIVRDAAKVMAAD